MKVARLQQSRQGAEMDDLLRGHAYFTKFSVGLEIFKSLVSHAPKLNLASRIIVYVVDLGC